MTLCKAERFEPCGRKQAGLTRWSMAMPNTFIAQLSGSAGAKFRLAAVLLFTFTAILGSKFWEDSYIESLRRDCGSMFQDRLLPATTLFHLSDEIHTKRHTLEGYLRSADANRDSAIEYEMGKHDAAIEHWVGQIEQTYLVAEESRLLNELKATLRAYNGIEQSLLDRRRAGQTVSYNSEIRSAFEQVRRELLGLTKVQQEVGRELNLHSVASATHVTALLYFQLGVAFILGLLASGLALTMGPLRGTTAPPKADSDLH